ncbi:MAG: hypothetical protein VX012_02100 [Planctomycetota bacterium]|nr:hypothetical protein [Planctomycetota bacterium]
MKLPRSILVFVGFGLAAIAGSAWAKDHAIAIGQDWPAPAAVSPGDRILLEPGLHPPRELRAYRGTREAPIEITARTTEVPTGIGSSDAGGWSLRLLDCDHLVVRSLLVMCAGAGGIEIEGPEGERGGTVGLVDLQLLPADPTAPSEEGVVARGLDRATLVGVRVRRWISNAVRIEDTRLADVRLLVNDGSPEKSTCRTGLRVVGTDRVGLDSCSFIGLTESGLDLRTEGSEKASSVQIARCVFLNTGTPVTIRPGAGTRVDASLVANTFVEPQRLIAVEEIADPEDSGRRPRVKATMDRGLVTWTVGGLQEIALAAPGILELTLARNLWASIEADLFFDGGAPFTDDQSAEQLIEVEVSLDPRTLLPRFSPALGFGHGFRPDNPNGPE